MKRQTKAAIIILRRAAIDKEMIGDEPQSDFDRWVNEQDTAMDLAADMLLDPVKHLTPEELRYAYVLQQHEYDKSDIEGELDIAADLINRQKLEIENLKIELQAMRNAANGFKKVEEIESNDNKTKI